MLEVDSNKWFFVIFINKLCEKLICICEEDLAKPLIIFPDLLLSLLQIFFFTLNKAVIDTARGW